MPGRAFGYWPFPMLGAPTRCLEFATAGRGWFAWINKEQLLHINSIAHASKIIIIATCDDGSLHYTVRQDGSEQSCLNIARA